VTLNFANGEGMVKGKNGANVEYNHFNPPMGGEPWVATGRLELRRF